jgi:hypothetical protein
MEPAIVMKNKTCKAEDLLALSRRAIWTVLEGLDLREVEKILGIDRQEDHARFVDPRVSHTLEEEVHYASEKLNDIVLYVADDEAEIKRAMQSVRRKVETVRRHRKRASILDVQYWMGRLVELENAQETFWFIGGAKTAQCQGFCLYATWVIEEWIRHVQRHGVLHEGKSRGHQPRTDVREKHPRLDLSSTFRFEIKSTSKLLQQHIEMFGAPPSQPKDLYRGQYTPTARDVPVEMPEEVSSAVRDQLVALPSFASKVLENERSIQRSEGTYVRIAVDWENDQDPHAADVYQFRGLEKDLQRVASSPQRHNKQLRQHLKSFVLPRLEKDSVLLEVETKAGFCEQVLLELGVSWTSTGPEIVLFIHIERALTCAARPPYGPRQYVIGRAVRNPAQDGGDGASSKP